MVRRQAVVSKDGPKNLVSLPVDGIEGVAVSMGRFFNRLWHVKQCKGVNDFGSAAAGDAIKVDDTVSRYN